MPPVRSVAPKRRVGAIRLSPRRALAEVRKPLPRPMTVEPDERRYLRARERRVTREIIADEAGGC